MSLRLRIANALMRFMVKPALRRAPLPADLRHMLDHAAQHVLRAPPQSLFLPRSLTPGLDALWIENRPAAHPPLPGKIMLYLHGGGFVAGSPTTHRAMLARLSRLSRLTICAPDYRLAPEHPFPAALDDARAAFAALVARGHAPGDIVLAGDSAGGNLALALLADLIGTGQRPAACLCFSPVTDLTFSGASMVENENADPVLPAERKGDIATWYLGDHDPADPDASPLFARFTDPPPVFLQVAGSEILRDDSRRMARILHDAGGQVTVDEWPDTPHVFVLLDGYVPEAREGLRRAATFIAGCLGRSP